MKLKFSQAILVVGMLLSSGCASILNPKNQTVEINTNSPKAKVYIDDQKVGEGRIVSAKMKRDLNVKQVKVEAEGYKTEYAVNYQKKYSVLHVFSFVPFGVLLYPMMMDKGPKAYNYPKDMEIFPKVKIEPRNTTQKFIYLRNTSFEVKKEDLIIEQFSERRYNKNKKSRNSTTSKEEIDIDNSIFTDALNSILKKNNYSDTTSTILKSKTNTMLVSARVSKIKFQRVASPRRYYNAYWVAEISVEWDLLDVYEQSKYKKTVISKSGQFAQNYNFSDKDDNAGKSIVVSSIEDAMTASFFQFLSDTSVKNFMQIEKAEKTKHPKLTLAKSTKAQSLKNAQISTVTIVTKKGHGSGCVVSKDGYIVTNYHVVAGQEKFEVITSNGDKLNAKFVRANETADLALIKVDEASTVGVFAIPLEKNYEVGDEVYAIGTPTSIELGQTLTRGIISGVRKQAGSELIQTDVSVNPGNSGGALVNKEGKLLAIVNSKVVGLGIEGISFCIPANEIYNLLSVE